MKAQLKEVCDKYKWEKIPEYSLVLKTGPDHAPIFKSKASITVNLNNG
jgi:dsRNA-specific ribonuclease